MSKQKSLAWVTLAYIVAIGVAALYLATPFTTGSRWADALIADVLATVVIFGFSRAFGNSSFYDAYWSVIPPLVVGYWWLTADQPDVARLVLALGVMAVWAVRLTANWVVGFPGLHHEDWRYPMLRENAGRAELVVDFAAIHLIPTLQVFLATAPLYLVATRHRDLGVLDAVAVSVATAAVVIETIADLQMRRFAANKQPGQAMDVGLWGWSRHPNYFGEFGFWVGIAIFGLAAAPGSWWVLAGPAAMLAMFLGASIPMMERRSLERRPDYQRVIDSVSIFVPIPPRRRRPGGLG